MAFRLHLVDVDERQQFDYVDERTQAAIQMRSLTPKDIGALVREARLEAGLTQTELAERIAASRFWVAEFERGKPHVSMSRVLQALQSLGLDVLVVPRKATSKLSRLLDDDEGA